MLCAYTMPRYQVSGYRTIGPLVSIFVVLDWATKTFSKVGETRLGEMGIGKMGQIIGETGIGEMGVDELYM